MEKRQLGSLSVSLVGLGCNNFGRRLDEGATGRVVDACLDNGVDFFDTADIYGGTLSEEFLGRVLKGRRERIVLATKFGMEVAPDKKGAKPEYIRQAVEASLGRLQTDRIDLYQLHAPDPEVPMEDTLGALDELVKAGKVREIGCSNFSAEQLREAGAKVKPGAARYASVQNEYSLFHRDPEKEVLAECRKLGITFLPYFPLASGLLTGKYRKDAPRPEGTRIAPDSDRLSEATLNRIEALSAFAQDHGRTLLELAMGYLAAEPLVVSVIAGATRPEQVLANVASVARPLSAEEKQGLIALLDSDSQAS